MIVVLAVITFGRQYLVAGTVPSNGSLKLRILDIGQGDAILINTPDNHQILTDGGPDASVLTELQRALAPGDKEIDLVISTHNDADHLGGLNYVLQHYKVKKLWLTGAVHTTQTYQRFIELIKTKQVPTEIVRVGTKIAVNGLEGIVIAPAESYLGSTPSQQNASGIVTFWQYGSQKFLLTADIDADHEQTLVSRGLVQPVEILKIAHHGSAGSSGQVFLEATKPKMAVISVGKNNRYNHPRSVILDRLKALAIPVLRTDQDGAIEFSIWPDRFRYATHR